jgi:hypothetical protein
MCALRNLSNFFFFSAGAALQNDFQLPLLFTCLSSVADDADAGWR